MNFIRSKSILLLALVISFTVSSHAGDWRFGFGAGIRNTTPMVLVGSIGYKDLSIKLQGLGYQSGPNDFWCGIRGSLLWTFFGNLPFNFDVGVGGGYDFAKAPNKIHQAFNDANNGHYLYGYNYKENLDVSLELWTHVYGFYTQISVPAYQFLDHDAPNILWGTGYMIEF